MNHCVLKSDAGAALFTAIIVMFIVTALAMTMMLSTTTDMKVSGNTLTGRKAFYLADAGLPMSMKLIEEIVDDHATPTSYTSVSINANFLNEVFGLYESNATLNDKATDTSQNNPDIVVESTAVDIDRLYESISSTGGSSSFGTAVEGVGYGSAGSIFVFYGVASSGSTNEAFSEIITTYRKVVAVGD